MFGPAAAKTPAPCTSRGAARTAIYQPTPWSCTLPPNGKAAGRHCQGVCSDGQYRWAPPLSVGSQVYVRLVARDLAGNATVVETSQPVIVDDLSRPPAG